MTTRSLKFVQSVALFALLFSLGGCSGFFYGKSNIPAPNPVPVVANNELTAVVWHKTLASKQKDEQLTLKPDAAGSTLFAVSENGKFYSIDARTGQENYAVDLGNTISAGVIAAGSLVYIGTKNGDILAVRQNDGQIVWRKPLGAMMTAQAAVAENILVAQTIDGTVTAFDPNNGELLWKYHVAEPVLSLEGSSSPIIGGGVVIVTYDKGIFVVLDSQSGVLIAKQRVAYPEHSSLARQIIDQNATPVINDSTMFASVYQKMFYALDLSQGKIKWQNEEVSTYRDFAISPTDIFLVTNRDAVVSLDQNDGHENWRNNDLLGRKLSPVISIPGRVGVVDYEGYLYWLDSETGKLIGQTKIGNAGSHVSALILPDIIIWQLSDGSLVGLRP